MKLLYLALFLFSGSMISAQVNATFENYSLNVGEHVADAGVDEGFSSGKVFLPNYYFPEFDSWAGWALSADTNTVMPGFNNQFSAITGSGFDGSRHYAVSSPGVQFSGTVLKLTEEHSGGIVEGLYVTNNTYAYLSMLNGDAFAKKFGGETGDDPDFFRLTVKKYLDGTLQPDSVNFFLADYRFQDNDKDYIIDDWTWLDLHSLGRADSLYFSLWSSDIGMFGMNTPAYFCVDDIQTTEAPTAIDEASSRRPLIIFPNPADEIIRINRRTEHAIYWRLYNSRGIPLSSGESLTGETAELSVGDLRPGLYFIVSRWKEYRAVQKIILQ